MEKGLPKVNVSIINPFAQGKKEPKADTEIDSFTEYVVGSIRSDEKFIKPFQKKEDVCIGKEQCRFSYEKEGGIYFTPGADMKGGCFQALDPCKWHDISDCRFSINSYIFSHSIESERITFYKQDPKVQLCGDFGLKEDVPTHVGRDYYVAKAKDLSEIGLDKQPDNITIPAIYDGISRKQMILHRYSEATTGKKVLKIYPLSETNPVFKELKKETIFLPFNKKISFGYIQLVFYEQSDPISNGTSKFATVPTNYGTKTTSNF